METVHYIYGRPPQWRILGTAVYLYYSGEFTPPVFDIQQGPESRMIIPQVELHLVKVSDVQDISSIGADYALRINRDAAPNQYNSPPNAFFIVANGNNTVDVVVTGDLFLRQIGLAEYEDEDDDEKELSGFTTKRFKYHMCMFYHIFHKFMVGVDQVNTLEMAEVDGFACSGCPQYLNCRVCAEC